MKETISRVRVEQRNEKLRGGKMEQKMRVTEIWKERRQWRRQEGEAEVGVMLRGLGKGTVPTNRPPAGVWEDGQSSW